jgi:glutathione S-transferase
MSAKVPQNSDVEAKKAARAAFVSDTLPKYATFFAGKLAGGPFFAGASLSLADLVFYATIAVSAAQLGQGLLVCPLTPAHTTHSHLTPSHRASRAALGTLSLQMSSAPGLQWTPTLLLSRPTPW